MLNQLKTMHNQVVVTGTQYNCTQEQSNQLEQHLQNAILLIEQMQKQTS